MPSDSQYYFPDVDTALAEPNGLLAQGGDLEPGRLLFAYRHGIFPWYSEGEPILWWSPDPRAVLLPSAFKVHRSFRKVLHNTSYRVSLNLDFKGVIEGCSHPRSGQTGTWLTREMKLAYLRLHHLGHAHSVETWLEDRLVGGLYGIKIGQIFFGESMFSHITNASKVALAYLVALLLQWQFQLIDCQQDTPHLTRLGAIQMPRDQFVAVLTKATRRDAVEEDWSARTLASSVIAPLLAAQSAKNSG
ncbi:MAG TPA: leucyl/phenylalanyl-tRNA--protein transferase [Gammaproteobacteria bacterium]|nr:leucyl/phenylalanyl-tRNA--protein transferase [Gammaproteobacteria bacterium]